MIRELYSIWGLGGAAVLVVLLTSLPLPAGGQAKCEDSRDQLAEHLQLLHNDRVAKESQVAALLVSLKRLEAENKQLKLKVELPAGKPLDKLEEK